MIDFGALTKGKGGAKIACGISPTRTGYKLSCPGLDPVDLHLALDKRTPRTLRVAVSAGAIKRRKAGKKAAKKPTKKAKKK